VADDKVRCGSCGAEVPPEPPDHHLDPGGPHPHAPALANRAFRLCERCLHRVVGAGHAGRYAGLGPDRAAPDAASERPQE
jgi:hypothetical protein